MDDLIQMILAGGLYVTAIGTLGSGIYFFISGGKANKAEAKFFGSETALNETRLESAKVANRVANEMGRKLASVDGLGEFAMGIGFEGFPKDGICQCSKCKARRGESNV